MRDVPTTVQPNAWASCTAAVPTPEPAACTSTRLTGRDRGLGDHRVVRGDEHLGHAAGGDEVERVGDAGALTGRHGEQLGLAATTGDAEHPTADCGLGDAGAERDDLARELEAGDVGGRAGRRGVVARRAARGRRG